MLKLSGLFLGILLSLSVQAQVAPSEYQDSYKSAERFIRNEKYDIAREQFGPLTSIKYQNDLVPYSHYFMALACLKSNRLSESRTYLLQLEQRYPNWNKLSDARYLFANILFEEKQYAAAVDAIKRLSDPKLTSDLQNMQRYYLYQCTNLNTLKQLHTKYPNDGIIAEQLVRLINQSSNATRAERDLATRLTSKFNIQSKVLDTPTPVATRPATAPTKGKKGVYNVAVLFPFKVSETSSATPQYITDLYEGIRLATKKLSSEGTSIVIQAYDVDNSVESMNRLVNNTQFQQTDVLIGPLYPQSYELALKWATDRNIPIINPISTNASILQSNTYLIHPSVETQAKSLLKYAARFYPKTGYVVYGTSRQDSLLAAAVTQQAAKEGVEIIGSRKGLSESAAADFTTKKPGHVLTIFTTPGSGQGIVSWYNRTGLTCPVLVSMESINLTTVSNSFLSNSKLHFYDSMYADESNAATTAFRQKYVTKFSAFPSLYAYLGYDTMLFFGRMLGKYGTDFEKGLKNQSYTDDYTMGGFDYRQSNDNQHFTFLKFNNYQFSVVN